MEIQIIKITIGIIVLINLLFIVLSIYDTWIFIKRIKRFQKSMNEAKKASAIGINKMVYDYLMSNEVQILILDNLISYYESKENYEMCKTLLNAKLKILSSK